MLVVIAVSVGSKQVVTSPQHSICVFGLVSVCVCVCVDRKSVV